MPKLETLTPQQESDFTAIQERWARLLRATETYDPVATERAVTEIYAAMGKAKPTVVTCGSPFQLGLIAGIITNTKAANANEFEMQARAYLEALSASNASKAIAPAFPTAIGQLTECVTSTLGWERMFKLLPKVIAQRKLLLLQALGFSKLSESLDREIDKHFDELLQRRVLSPFQSNRWNLAQFVEAQLRDDLDPRTAEERRRRQQAFIEMTRNRIDAVADMLRNPATPGVQQPITGRADVRLVPTTDMAAMRMNPASFLPLQELLFFWRNAARLALFEFCGTMPEFKLDQVAMRFAIMARSIHALVRFDDICFVSQPPVKLSWDDRERVHSESGPAIEYSDGYTIYAWHGVAISRGKTHIIDRPAQITVSEIDEEPNIALRRVMIERFGLERFIKESGAKIINQDRDTHTGHERILYRREVPPDEPIVMVAVTNSTPEADGTYKQYFIRVPPNIRTAHEAVAWTFGLSAAEYKPSQQT